jgi:hypothetical protein
MDVLRYQQNSHFMNGIEVNINKALNQMLVGIYNGRMETIF